jgi:hypothetical protein
MNKNGMPKGILLFAIEDEDMDTSVLDIERVEAKSAEPESHLLG